MMKLDFEDNQWVLTGGSAGAKVTHTPSSTLELLSGPRTDWWKEHSAIPPQTEADRRTGPSYTIEVDGKRDFVAGVWIRGEWRETFNQGTLFLHAGPEVGSKGWNWLKAGVELDSGKQWLG